MQIDRLVLQNFKQFAQFELEFDSRFNLLVGDNGTGKTSILEALTVALGIWLVKPPDPELNNSRRNIYKHEIRLEAVTLGDRAQFSPCRPTRVEAVGRVMDVGHHWVRQIGPGGEKTSNQGSAKTLTWISKCFEMDRRQPVIYPVLAYYGAGRAWLPSNERPKSKASTQPARRWSAYYDCFSERVHFAELTDWFRREALAALNFGKYRAGFEVVQRAICRCVPYAEKAWFDPDRQEIVLSIAGSPQPLGNLSAGQKMMLALVADLAIKAVSLNNSLVTEDDSTGDLPYILKRTPGVVLIDELDVHLHPIWQRRVISDLTSTFPLIQFVSTTHSPFIIQSLDQGKLIRLGTPNKEPFVEEKSLDDIAEVIQGVDSPHQSLRDQRLEKATERYFRLLRAGGCTDKQDLIAAEREYREASVGYTGKPGLDAILKIEALAAEQGYED